MEALFAAEAWALPGGVGFFLVYLRGLFYFMFQLDTKKKELVDISA